MRRNGFQAERGRVVAIPGEDGGVAAAVVELGPLRGVEDLKLWHAASRSERLPPRDYRLESSLPPSAATHFLLGWGAASVRARTCRSVSPMTIR